MSAILGNLKDTAVFASEAIKNTAALANTGIKSAEVITDASAKTVVATEDATSALLNVMSTASNSASTIAQSMTEGTAGTAGAVTQTASNVSKNAGAIVSTVTRLTAQPFVYANDVLERQDIKNNDPTTILTNIRTQYLNKDWLEAMTEIQKTMELGRSSLIATLQALRTMFKQLNCPKQLGLIRQCTTEAHGVLGNLDAFVNNIEAHKAELTAQVNDIIIREKAVMQTIWVAVVPVDKTKLLDAINELNRLLTNKKNDVVREIVKLFTNTFNEYRAKIDELKNSANQFHQPAAAASGGRRRRRRRLHYTIRKYKRYMRFIS